MGHRAGSFPHPLSLAPARPLTMTAIRHAAGRRRLLLAHAAASRHVAEKRNFLNSLRQRKYPTAKQLARIQARGAINAWASATAQAELRAMEASDPSPPGCDLDAPWWLLAVDRLGLPSFALMGLAAPGLRPDWPAIQSRAHELFLAAARRSRGNLPQPPSIAPVKDLWCAGRCLAVSVALFSLSRVQPFGRIGLLGRVDSRRARRRSAKPVSAVFAAFFHAQAAPLWALGFALSHKKSAFAFAKPTILRAFASAMVEHGATRVQLCPDFFKLAQNPPLQDEVEAIDAQCADSIRARWAMERSASTPPRDALRRAGSL